MFYRFTVVHVPKIELPRLEQRSLTHPRIQKPNRLRNALSLTAENPSASPRQCYKFIFSHLRSLRVPTISLLFPLCWFAFFEVTAFSRMCIGGYGLFISIPNISWFRCIHLQSFFLSGIYIHFFRYFLLRGFSLVCYCSDRHVILLQYYQEKVTGWDGGPVSKNISLVIIYNSRVWCNIPPNIKKKKKKSHSRNEIKPDTPCRNNSTFSSTTCSPNIGTRSKILYLLHISMVWRPDASDTLIRAENRLIRPS